VKKTTAKKKAVRKKTVSRKQPVAAKASKVSSAPRSRRKAASGSIAMSAGGRRGRPVSIEVLQRRLEASENALRQQKEKRRKLSQSSKQRLAVVLEAKGKLKAELAALKKTLSSMLAAQKAEEKAAQRRQKMEQERNTAIAGFVQRWEKKYLAKQSTVTGRKRKATRRRRGKAE